MVGRDPQQTLEFKEGEPQGEGPTAAPNAVLVFGGYSGETVESCLLCIDPGEAAFVLSVLAVENVAMALAL